MTPTKRRRKKNIANLVLTIIVILIGVTIFILIYDKAISPFVRDLMTATLASLITIVITAVLLRYQTEMEETRQATTLLYQQKFGVYERFLNDLALVVSEKKPLEAESLHQLQTSLYKTLLFIKSRTTFDVIYVAVKDYLENGEMHGLTKVVICLRQELDSSQDEVPRLDKNTEAKIDELFEMVRLGAKKQDN